MGFAGLALKRTRDVRGDRFHIGLLHRSESAGIRLLHLAFHEILRNEFPSPDYAWLDLNVDEYLAKNIAARCRNVFASCGPRSIGYSFAPGTTFADDYSLSSPSRAVGFTCATFVMRLLEDGGLVLLDQSSWQHRPDDGAWQREVIEDLRAADVSAEHISYLEQAVGVFRFTPLDVAAAVTLGAPATFEQASAVAASLSERL